MARMRPAVAASRTSMALLPTALPNDEHEDVSDSAAAAQDDVLTAAQARPRRESRGVQRFVASAAPPPRIAHAAAKRGATEGVSPSEAADAVFVRRARLQAAAGAPTWIMFEPPAAADSITSITSSSANSGDFQYILGGQYILHNTERLDQINSVLRDWQAGGDGSLVAPPSDETSEQTKRERAAQASRTLAARAEKRQRARPQLEEPVIRQPDSHAATRETGIRRAAR